MTEPDSGSAPRRAHLTLFDVACIGLGGIIGTGIFVLPGRLYALMGGLSPLAFVLAAASAVPIALCFGEMASRTTRSGGPYAYAREAFGPRIGFGVGWLVFVSFCVSWPAVALGVPEYLSVFIPAASRPAAATAIAVGLVLFTGAINYAGLRPGAIAIDLLTVGKVVPLLALGVMGLAHVEPARLAPPAELPTLEAVRRAWFLAMFAVGGFEGAPVPAAETADPRRNVPRAVLGSLGIAGLVYILVQTVAVGTVPGLGASQRPLADAGAVVFGWWGTTAVAVAGLVSMLGFVSGAALLASRALGALADDGELPSGIARAHPRFGTPSGAIVLTTVVAAVLALTTGFDMLLEMAVLVQQAQFLGTCGGLWVLRRREAVNPARFRVPLGRATIGIAILVSLALASQASLIGFAVTGAVLVGGYGARAATRRRSRGGGALG